MVAAASDARATSPVFLLCPNCQKRLPLSGSLSIRGTVGIYAATAIGRFDFLWTLLHADPEEEDAQDQ